jgi:hypothetical protein
VQPDIATTMTPLFPNEAPFELSAYYPASRIRFVHIPAGVCESVPLISSGAIHTPVAAIYPLSAFPDAVARVQRGGKVLFEMAASAGPAVH